jgi:hypothetical protein
LRLAAPRCRYPQLLHADQAARTGPTSPSSGAPARCRGFSYASASALPSIFAMTSPPWPAPSRSSARRQHSRSRNRWPPGHHEHGDEDVRIALRMGRRRGIF